MEKTTRTIYLLALTAAVLTITTFGCGGEAPDVASEQTRQAASVQASDADFEDLLSGQTLARYRALPPAFREALASYVWHGVPSGVVPLAVKDKMEQWGDAPLPLAEILGEERAERFRLKDPRPVQHGHLLLSYYVYVLNTEPSAESRMELMREAADLFAPPQIVDEGREDEDGRMSPYGGPESLPEVPLPSLDSVLTNTALARIDRLGPSLREGLLDTGIISSSGETEVRNLALILTWYEMFAQKAEPGLDVPSIDAVLTGEALSTFRALSQERQGRAADMFRRRAISDYVVYVATTRRPVESATISVALAEVLSDYASHAVEFQTLSGGRVAGGVASSEQF